LRIKTATYAAAALVAALLVNHVWVGIQAGRIAAAANVGVQLPGSLRFLVKLDHFAMDYGYVLIPLAWVAVFVVASIGLALRDLFGAPKSAGIAEDWPFEA
jgi:hypothetical protein